MTKIHLDTDIGGDIDDLCALAMLLRWPDVEITGVTTVTDPGGRRAGYVRRVLDLAGFLDVPVAAGDAGEDTRWSGDFPPEDIYWGAPVAPSPGPLDAALALLKQSIDAGARIIAVGPYTNLLRLEDAYPGLLETAALYIMGGYVQPIPPGFPRWTYGDDYNVQCDIVAARFVFEHLTPTVVPIELTVRTAVRRAALPALREAGPLGMLLARQVEAEAAHEGREERFGKVYAKLPDDFINFLHDPLACAVALGWAGVAVANVTIAVSQHGAHLRETINHQPTDGRGRSMRLATTLEKSFDDLWLRIVTGRARAGEL